MVGCVPAGVAIRPVEENDRPTVEWLTTQLWGAAEVVVHDGAFYPATLPGFIAERAGRIAGLVTFEVRQGVLEIATINALDLYQGIGTMLIEAVRAEAKRLGCHQVTLTTTNDNIGALRFYQRRGFRLAASARARWTAPGSASRRFPVPAISAFRCAMKSTSPVPFKKKRSKSAIPNVRGFPSYLTCALSPAGEPLSGAIFTRRVRARAVARTADALYRDLPLSEGARCCHPLGSSPQVGMNPCRGRRRPRGDRPAPRC